MSGLVDIPLSHQEEIKAEENDKLSEYNKEFIKNNPQNEEDISDFSKHSIFKIIVIGDTNVGKTCLTYRFCEGKFPEKTEATIGVDFRDKTVKIGKDILKLQIWDTAGQERFRKSMVQQYYRNAHAVLFVYDVTRMSTFENLPSWMEECQKNGVLLEVPRVVVGNKCDSEAKGQVVPTSLAQRFADGRQMALFETSAKEDSMANHVESIFLTIAHKLNSSKTMLFTPLPHPDTHRLDNRSSNNSGGSGWYGCWC